MTAAPTSKYAISFVFITVLLDMVGFGLIMPVLPTLIQSVGHMDIAHASFIGGWLFAAFSVTQFLFGPTMGNLSDAYGRRPLLLLAVAGLFVDYLIMALAPSIAWLFVGRLFAGFCGASYVVANAYIADVTPPEGRAKAFGMMGAAFGLGFVPRALERLQAKCGAGNFPQVSLQVLSSKDVRDRVASGQSDFGLMADEMSLDGIDHSTFAQFPGVVVMPPAHAPAA